ncbi:hypothetical protein FJY94_01605 [Candidatus Kaiserbacteria bacterium]|nr:hypothetical protein [Candidatus Kaiserbacteria bacterium]
MFNRLMDFSYTRSKKQAFGFYLAFFLLGILLSALAGGIVGLSGVLPNEATFETSFAGGMREGVLFAIPYSLIVACTVLIKKRQYGSFRYVLLVIVSGLLAMFGGMLLGLLIPAYLTTKEQASA